MHPVETYLRDLYEIRSTGAAVKETSFYPALANLLNAVGQQLRPRVRCVINLKNQGAGLPDGGLFTPDQLQKGAEEPHEGQPPARGAIECKGTKDDAWVTADGAQVTAYWNKYRQVLVTNYRDFVLVAADEATGKPVKRETFRLAPTEKAFWGAAAHPAALVERHGERFVEYLRRVMLHAAPLTDPKDVAWFLASYARDARARLAAARAEALAPLREALGQALGLTFTGPEGEHFFRSTLVQTLFYGVFSAWVLWHRTHHGAGQRFDREKSSKYLHLPVLRKLFREVSDPGQLEEWRLEEVLDWTADVLNRVDRPTFFGKFRDAEAVQYFYEPFLEAFDPELRKQLGVWYTPPEVVRYMAARVDTVLREDLGRPDGLADDDVFVLDPCCGTGAYLVEVLRRIADRLKERGEDALLGARLKKAATERLFGFEILPAPFVVAHLQMGLFLQAAGVPLDEAKKERAAVFLTNALTGWEPPKGPKQHLLFPELEEERDRAEAIKQKKPILVVIGNPPYNGFAGVSVDEERSLSDAYRWKDRDPDDLKPQGQGLNDLYVRFFRMAERCIVERQPMHGVVCFISNYSWLEARSFPLMQQRYLNEFDNVWIDCLNGDKYRTGKMTPDGKPDPSVFSTEHNREGIQVGTAIALMVRKPGHQAPAAVRYRDLWGQMKRVELLASLEGFSPKMYEQLTPERSLGLPFRQLGAEQDYLAWPLLSELFPIWFTGVKTSRDEVVVDIDEQRLRDRMVQYFDASVSHEEMGRISPRAIKNAARFEGVPTREALIKRGLLVDNFMPFAYRPFDLRWLYWEPLTKLLDEKRPEYVPHVFPRNVWLAAAQQNRKEYDPPTVLQRVACIHIIERSANLFPLLFRDWPEKGLFQTEAKEARRLGDHFANLSDAALAYLADRGGVSAAPDLFHHTAAVLHAPAYAEENAGALRQDWPRVPLPAAAEALRASAALGRQVAALLDPETAVPGVAAAPIRPEMRVIGAVARVGGGSLNPSAGELEVTARWGVAGKGGVCMPSTGRLTERDYTPEEMAALGPDEAAARAGLGDRTFDVYLNDVAFWRNVPAKVWAYTLGGYQVMKKWLSYREKALLGRGLTLEEVAEVTNMARRIAALLLLRPALDASYRAVKAAAYPWSAKAPAG
ncbi:MAG TPA: type ISP restriction/modification enzyme [Gemmataceae bacterium]|nr:type ISP restriction/modification enzyme [Gemmataceae bacterium]